MSRLAMVLVILSAAVATVALGRATRADPEPVRPAGGGGSATPARPGARLRPTSTARSGAASIRSRDARITAGRTVTVLALPRIGRFLVACDRAAHSVVTFVPDHLLPSSDVVVSGLRGSSAGMLQPERPRTAWRRPASVVAETWQIAPFAEAQVHVVTARVTSRATHGLCAASVLAVIGPDQGHTLTAALRSRPPAPADSVRPRTVFAGAPSAAVARRQRPARAARAVGLSWSLPPGWHAVDDRLTGLSEPSQALVAATFPLRQPTPDRGCGPATALRRLPSGGALVILLEARAAAGVPSRLRDYPRRPPRFRLPARAQPLECFGLAREVTFRDRDRAFLAFVSVGARAGTRRLTEARELLDNLSVERILPPARPEWDLWRELVTESGDSMHVPPGWCGWRLAIPRAHPRPRLLFRLASRPGAPDRRISMRVVEVAPGPASTAYPPLRRDPLARRDRYRPVGSPPETTTWRAGAAWRGFRFAVRITAGEAAPPRDIDRAFTAAASLALSGGHRDCPRAGCARAE